MTAQIADIYRYKKDEYKIIGMTKPMTFNPHDYGLEPQSCCTACWRGYWCEYDIRDNGLYLEKLFMFNREDKYPELNGVSVSPIEYQEGYVSSLNGMKRRKTSFPKYSGHRLYEGVNLFIQYTGKILAGKNFLSQYYIHMGYQKFYAYEIVKEFIFEEGVLQDIVDHSDFAKSIRESIDLKDPSWKYKVTTFELLLMDG